MEKLPVYGLVIDANTESDLEVNYVALVDRPAIEKNFLAFNKESEKAFKFQFDEEKRIMFGPFMLADFPIYRSDDELGEYMVVFNAQSIETIVQKYFKKDFHKNFNLSHDPNQKQEGVYVFESYIVNTALGKLPPKGYEDVKEGSWFGAVKVENEEVWNQVKAGTFKGFSVEGMFKYKKLDMQKQLTPAEQLLKDLKEIFENVEL